MVAVNTQNKLVRLLDVASAKEKLIGQGNSPEKQQDRQKVEQMRNIVMQILNSYNQIFAKISSGFRGHGQ
ncbi:MAG: hypothetical protein L7U87_01105 [Chlamydiales bacterium]|nr:hypothetical protein [Chlamydiales bacterium]